METESLIPLEAAAGRINVSIRTLYRLVADGELPPPVKVGRSSKMCISEVNDYIERIKARRLHPQPA